MAHFRIKTVLTWLALAAAALPAAAQDKSSVSFTIGLGLRVTPDYFGADSYGVGPTGLFALEEVILPGGIIFGSAGALPTDPGLTPRGAFRLIQSRKASDNRELRGLDDIGPAFEIGAGLFKVTEHFRAFGEVRRGVGGHQGWVAETGVDAILRPTERLVLSLGPRADWGDKDFFRTYFGVTAAEAARSDFTIFRPDGGLASLGLELDASYDFRNGWGLQGRVRYDRLQDDASNSPITKQGDDDQFSVRLIVTRRFGLGF